VTNIGVISDTHGLLRPEVITILCGVDYIIHAGDIGDPQVIEQLKTIAAVHAIKGNIDREMWANKFDDKAQIEIAGHKVFVIHNRDDLAFDPSCKGFNIVVSGHSHKPSIETINGVLYLNPGSAGPRRFTLPIALATLKVTGNTLEPTIHEIEI